MKLTQINTLYFIGIGGIGMSAIARYFKTLGKAVSGYDKAETELTKQLVEEGIHVYYDENVERIPKDADVIIYTPAIPPNNTELQFYQTNNYSVLKRSDILQLITEQSFTIAVAGTHGKTTTTAMITHVLYNSEESCTGFVGGILTNYDSNFLRSENAQAPVVVEADEFDRSFLKLVPNIAVITSMDADHLDIYGTKNELEKTFQQFAEKLKPDGLLIHKQNLPLNQQNTLTYSLNSEAQYTAKNIMVKDGFFVFDAITPTSIIIQIKLGIAGRHNIENALACVAVCQNMNISDDYIKSSLENFKGIKRRFEYIIKEKNLVYIDDYAHHPEELRAAILSARELYPDKTIKGIFQPHLYTRTRDFADEFARSLELLDEVILLDIYPARELPIPKVTSRALLKKIQLPYKSLVTKKELLHIINKNNTEVLLTLGAGDIDKLVKELKLVLQN